MAYSQTGASEVFSKTRAGLTTLIPHARSKFCCQKPCEGMSKAQEKLRVCSRRPPCPDLHLNGGVHTSAGRPSVRSFYPLVWSRSCFLSSISRPRVARQSCTFWLSRRGRMQVIGGGLCSLRGTGKRTQRSSCFASSSGHGREYIAEAMNRLEPGSQPRSKLPAPRLHR